MKPRTKKQIESGLRIGCSLAGFFIAVMLFGLSLERFRGDPTHLRFWPDGAVAASTILVAVFIILFTARVWILYLAGCLLFAIPKLLITIASGHNFYAPHEPFSRSGAAELLLFSVASLFLLFRMTQNHTPVIADRFAFTFFTFCFVFGLSRQNAATVAFWHVLALATLTLTWFLARKKHRRRHIYGGESSFEN